MMKPVWRDVDGIPPNLISVGMTGTDHDTLQEHNQVPYSAYILLTVQTHPLEQKTTQIADKYECINTSPQ
jgi:hypothetical protein